ncbi:MAG TPA: sensor domain-containing diguanylate cyclase [Coriobacteriia bacterium]|nr:sensor domain-containing diguanylate cyclase [Coriobacteriia bacterium]
MENKPDIYGTSDLTVHITPERQLEFMRTLVDSAVDAIIVHEPGGRLVFFNQGALDLLGMTSQQLEALAPYGWVGRRSKTGAAGRLEEVLHDRRSKFMSSVLNASGELIPTEVIASRFDSDQGPLIVAVIRDVRERAEVAERLEYLAYHDSLTGLANRAAFEDRLRLALADARRYGDLLMLAYVDLDHFKPINDLYGHEAGDHVLIEVAKRLLLGVREQDAVARLGGDEFVVLLQRAESADEIVPIAERLLSAVRQPIAIAGATAVEIDASIGFSIFDSDADDARSLVVKADTAMYAAKADPTRAWLVYQASMGAVEPALAPRDDADAGPGTANGTE